MVSSDGVAVISRLIPRVLYKCIHFVTSVVFVSTISSKKLCERDSSHRSLLLGHDSDRVA